MPFAGALPQEAKATRAQRASFTAVVIRGSPVVPDAGPSVATWPDVMRPDARRPNGRRPDARPPGAKPTGYSYEPLLRRAERYILMDMVRVGPVRNVGSVTAAIRIPRL